MQAVLNYWRVRVQGRHPCRMQAVLNCWRRLHPPLHQMPAVLNYCLVPPLYRMPAVLKYWRHPHRIRAVLNYWPHPPLCRMQAVLNYWRRHSVQAPMCIGAVRYTFRPRKIYVSPAERPAVYAIHCTTHNTRDKSLGTINARYDNCCGKKRSSIGTNTAFYTTPGKRAAAVALTPIAHGITIQQS